MTFDAVFDRLFLVPFVNGLLLALVLPAVGAYSRIRGEWLASLAVGQATAAGIAMGTVVGLPVAVGALLAAFVAAPVKTLLGHNDGDDTYAVIFLAGWSLALLTAANAAHGEDLAQALLQGQIYFTSTAHLTGIVIVVVAVATLLPWVSGRLLLGRFFPEYYRANGVSNPRHEFVFDLLVAVTLALAAAVVGVMGAFALVFVPPWVAFRVAHGWRRTVVWSAALGTLAYVVSFALAIVFDQPYGPVLVATLLTMAVIRPFLEA
jgi:zinc transport system permease protein